MFAGKKSAQIREILISESAWEEMTCLFAPSLDVAETDELYCWIKNYCIRYCKPFITKNTILQYGPNKFRNRSKANELLSTLFSQNKILVGKKGKTTLIAIAGLNASTSF